MALHDRRGNQKPWEVAQFSFGFIGEDGVIQPVSQRYVMVIPQPPDDPVARAIFASKADADRFLNHETVPVQWQGYENGQWVDMGEVQFQFKKYEPPENKLTE